MRVHLLDDWFDTLRHLPGYARLAGHKVTVWTDHCADPTMLAQRLNQAQALVLFRERTAITAELLAQLPNLRLISLRGSYPHVDIAACRAHGVMVCANQAADMPSYPTAELAFGLMISALRDLPAQMNSLRAGHWQAGVGRGLRGLTLGLYGYGKIGAVMAGLGRAFGMKVMIWGSEATQARARADGHEVASDRAAFFALADVISLHLKLTPTTRGVISADDLRQMKPDALLVNTSRAGLIAPGALHAALDAGRPGRAALDVFDVEPTADDPLIHHPRVLATPHIGFVTQDELDRQFTDAYDQVNAFAAGQPIYVVS